MEIMLVTRSFVVEKGKVLLLKRTLTNAHNPGLWECPGGQVEEQNFLISQMRGVVEETGLLTKPISPISYNDRKVITAGKYRGSLCIRIFNISRIVCGELKLSEEHDEFVWITYKEMLSYNLTPEVRNAAKALSEYLF